MEAWARWCYRHKGVVPVLWAAALLGLGAAGRAGLRGEMGGQAVTWVVLSVLAAVMLLLGPLGKRGLSGRQGARPAAGGPEPEEAEPPGAVARKEQEPWGSPSGPSYASAVHGFVRTDEGDAVGSAALVLSTVDGRRLDGVESLADGSYILAAPAAGPYLLTVTATGFTPRTRRVLIGEEPTVHDLALEETAVDAVN
ncbi:carboxypeptidase-like regulatory domain-containing protein [Streptomyces sp. NBC_00872]|uniref:carboxypeptidase-like regulatory domain-containing protein n=1 Tax=Streptomyces sp. NBC_00872 TaxID=2903686 RepID=UPI003863EC12|nr:carboxypeptidase-like regulatory domain-containing protein [Streptomyces sp. NBC_00872]